LSRLIRREVLGWTVPLTVDGEPVAVKGSLSWTGLAGLSTFAITLIAAGGTAGVALAVAMAVVVRKERAGKRVPHEPRHVSD
jgi:hypothetical protein